MSARLHPTAAAGKSNLNSTVFSRVSPRLLLQRIIRDTASARQGAITSQVAMRTKTRVNALSLIINSYVMMK